MTLVKDVRLSKEQIEILKRYGENFRNWINTDSGRKDIEEHRNHVSYFKERLSHENLNAMTEDEFAEIWDKSWAGKMWHKKEWYVKNKIVAPNGIDKIRNGLILLLYGSEDFAYRYDKFRENVAGFGVAIISEFLNMVFPDRFCLWNNKPRTVLPFLGLDGLPENLYRYNTASGEEYLLCVRYLDQIRNELSEFGIKDFIDLDIFLWYIFSNVMSEQDKKPIQLDEESKESPTPTAITNLQDLIRSYDQDKNFFGPHISEEDAMKLRSQFVSDFPADKIVDMDIDDYVFGKVNPETGKTNQNTFCYRLEFGAEGFGGIRGTPNDKFGIYCDKRTQNYIYYKDRYDSPEKAFDAIKSQITSILEAGKQFEIEKDWKAFAQSLEGKFDIQRHVRSKILSIYYPREFLLMHSNEDARHILESLFGVPKNQIDKGLFLKQAKLLELKNSDPIMKKWSNFDYSTFIWRAVSPKLKKKEIRKVDEEPLWVIRAGSKGEQEKEALENNIVTIGWNSLPDLSSVSDKQSLTQLYMDRHPDEEKMSVANMVGSIWRFINEIKKGDLVFLPLKSEGSKTIAIGKIEGDYNYKEIAPEIKHVRYVKWLVKNILKSEFDEDIIKQFNRPPTVYKIQGNDAIQKIKNVLNRYGISNMNAANLVEAESKKETEVPITLEDVSRQTYFSLDVIKEIEILLNEKKQIIFYGPPGTSKTYFAKIFAQYFTKSRDNTALIQFHPSYSYEDFIEGIKPNLSASGEANGFSRQDGFFKKLVNKCSANPNSNYVLIIDEINRGNIAKIFGELIYLLEYRKEKVVLTYSPNGSFSIPSNLYIIGTMNSADRSIAFVDYALRRRFYFKNFYPDSNVHVLRKWFEDHPPKQISALNIIHMLEEINKIIVERLGREYEMGYSYLMKQDLDQNAIKRIIDYAIIPLLEQYFFGKKERLEELIEICNRATLLL